MAEKTEVVFQQIQKPIKILKWKVSEGNFVSIGTSLLMYDFEPAVKEEHRKLKSTKAGTVRKLLAQEGAIVNPGKPLLELEACIHPTVVKDMCAECGADLRKDDIDSTASIPMIHSVPDLKVSKELAQKIGKADEERLLRDRKLVLLVDLDQTLIHTTNDIIPPNIKDVYHFQLYGPHSPWYHTRLRPGTHQFLTNISPYFELHICTFGARNYAHKITQLLDPDGRFFSNRVLSRDECFNPTSKTANLSALFPCGDHMVCIIDDREDVWSYATNLIHVKPYHFFQHTGDINAPPGLDKHEDDDKMGVDLSKIIDKDKNEIQEKDNKDNSNGENEMDNDKQTNEENEDNMNNVKWEEHANSTKEQERNGSYEEENKTSKQDSEENLKDESSMSEKEEKSEIVVNGIQNSVLKDEIDVSGNSLEGCKINETYSLESEIDESITTNLAEKSDNCDINSSADVKSIENNLITNEQISITNTENIIATDTLPISVRENIKETPDSSKMELDKPLETVQNKFQNVSESNDERKVEVEDHTKSSLNSSLNLIEIDDPDDYLLYLEDILMKVHKTFYEQYDRMESGAVPDLKKIIPEVKSQVLKGTKLVFSGLVPTHVQLEHSKAYLVAKSLGAEVTQDLEDDTTHLVAVRRGTAKVNAGRRKKNLKIVTPDWLWACAERWEHTDEKLFPLSSKASKNRHPPPHCSSPEHVPDYGVQGTPAARKRTDSGRFMDTINPLMSFSTDDIADMDKEVEDTLEDGDSESEQDAAKITEELDEIEEAVEETEKANNLFSELNKDDETDNRSSSSSSEDDFTGELPRGHKRRRQKRKEVSTDDQEQDSDSDAPSVKFRRGENIDSDLDMGDGSNSEGSIDAPDEIDDGEWNMMGAALEREFLSNN